jgi:hypothetical protein
MQQFEQELRNYLVSKFVLKKHKPVFTLFAVGGCSRGLYLVYLEIDGFTMTYIP